MALVAMDGSYLQVNPAFCQMLGYSEDELLNINFQALTYTDDLETDIGYLSQLLAGQAGSSEIEKRYWHKEGHLIWVLLSRSLVHDPQGHPLYFITQLQDITRRKQA
jgi:PAS domain S-box-containing protein